MAGGNSAQGGADHGWALATVAAALAGVLLAGIAFTYLMMMFVYPGRER